MKFPRREFLKTGAGSLALLATVGCDKLPHELKTLFALQPNQAGPFQPPTADQIDPISHVLNRAVFGGRPGDYQRIRKLGSTPEAAAAAYLEEQLTPEKLED